MKNRDSKGWIWPPADLWIIFLGPLSMIISCMLAGVLLPLISRLTDTRWISCYFTALAVASFGIGLLVYAKLPLYRQHRFFTFGARALPEPRRPFYRWGYACVIFSAILLLILLLSKP